MKNIRNFSIIAHIDHGKSTLADRFIQICQGLTEREMSNQVLDSMELEKERGITIKAQNVTIKYINKNKKIFYLNFIDTPGHVDFAYEVSRSLSACEGALLVIDSCQGIEAQTIATCNMALKMNLTIIPVLNKIDLPTANTQRVIQEIKELIGISTKHIVKCSAKTGTGITELLDTIVTKIPPPSGCINSTLQALIIDSWFDNYLGVVSLVRIKNGKLIQGLKIQVFSTKKNYYVNKIGIFTPKSKNKNYLHSGEVGWISCGIKNIKSFPVGDTITSSKHPIKTSICGFKKIKPKIYAGLFPRKTENYKLFRIALEKLSLNDASLFYQPEFSHSLGFGFKCGFLGLLHMEIIQARLEREYKLDVISTIPSVIYEIQTLDNNIVYIYHPSDLSKYKKIKEIREPIARCNILTPIKYIGNILNLCSNKRGKQHNIIYHSNQVTLQYDIPMSEIVVNFFDQLKSSSQGYASLEYDFKYFQKTDIVCLDILINTKKIDALSLIIHRENSKSQAHKIVNKIKTIIPKHQFNIVIQAMINNNIIARATIKQLRKNVLSKCYGGDISRKRKLLEKQKKGKKKMKQIGNVKIPKETFFSIFSIK
ncbi:translation elongation factor 4 [Buchnera aphidicola]|uniref:Elongation factor 4 n=1 Tax=Buchnera aphidicola (Stegophylla sp.) TaxID=2315800 RepID=A0A4D6Y8R0_9GAMM|nr:translation elongation factor 4 [Buchnera aphidicola (Stegophylla sp.)]QCI26346.1 elongation factor 4 [Buchnera aphidicola (Stegophylla sp.)]